MSQRTAGGLVRCPRGPNTQELSGTAANTGHACSRGPFPRSRFAHACCAISLPNAPLSRYSRGSCTFVPRSELGSRNARVPFVAIHRRAHHDAHHDGMACAPRAGPNLFAAKVPLMLNPPPRRAHDGAPSASRRPRLRRPLRRHPRRQRPRWWRPQRGAAAAARRAGWRCGYRVRYTRRS